jgi:hypothetical protein
MVLYFFFKKGKFCYKALEKRVIGVRSHHQIENLPKHIINSWFFAQAHNADYFKHFLDFRKEKVGNI